MNLALRPARPDDRDPIWRVHDCALRASALDYDPEYNRYLRHVDREFHDEGGQFLVGTVPPGDVEGDADGHTVEGRSIVAIGGYQPLSNLSPADHPPAFDRPADRTARVRSIAVLPACQGRGVGSTLVDRLEADARAAGFDHVVLSSVAEMTEARAFWRSLGYERLRACSVSGTDSVWYRASL